MRRVLLIALAASAMAGCGATSKVAQAPAPTTLAATLGDHPASSSSAPLMADQVLSPPPPAPPPAPKGQCDAPSLAYLVGRPRTDIPVPADLSHRRVLCTTCPAVDGYHPDRTSILFNASTGIVTAVNCG